MRNRLARELTFGRKPLAAVAVIAGAVPFAIGLMNQPRSDAANPLTFEVASIKPSNPDSPGPTMRFLPGGRLSVTGMTIQNLICLAYGIQGDQLLGRPKWLDSALYDIEAKPAAGSPRSPGQRGMEEEYQRVRALLADRCQLRAHRGTRSSPVYLLTVAKAGLRMQEAKGTDPSAKDRGSILPWKAFLVDLSRRLGRPVVDRTGLQGTWYVKLQYESDDGQPAGIGVRIDPAQAAGQVYPSLTVALREQLGLNAESAKGSQDTLVIDSVSRPSAN